MTDLQQSLHLAVDGGVFAGIIDTNLNETEQCTQDEADQDCQPGLLVGQAIGELDIHESRASFTFRALRKHSRSVPAAGTPCHTFSNAVVLESVLRKPCGLSFECFSGARRNRARPS
ncbi:hypothetical protein D3C72_1330610 [compost metagenome]